MVLEGIGEATKGGLRARRRAAEQLLEPWLGSEAMKPAAPVEGLVAQPRILSRQLASEDQERLEIEGNVCCADRTSHAQRGPLGPSEIQQQLD
jgi:hypothetical protein